MKVGGGCGKDYLSAGSCFGRVLLVCWVFGFWGVRGEEPPPPIWAVLSPWLLCFGGGRCESSFVSAEFQEVDHAGWGGSTPRIGKEGKRAPETERAKRERARALESERVRERERKKERE